MTDDDLHRRWHRAVCNELEGRVKDRRFLVSVAVEAGQGEGGAPATPEEVDPAAWEAVADSTEKWLTSLNQATVDRKDNPTHELRVADVRVELSAAPKKTARHGTGSLIANPFPGIVAFSGPYTAGPAEPFNADE